MQSIVMLMLEVTKRCETRRSLSELDLIELDLLVEALLRVHGIDLRSYAPAPLQRRMLRWLESQHLPSFSSALHTLLRDPAKVQILLQFITIGVTEMFRDPEVFQLLRNKIVPQLATSTRVRVWHAGCSSGEEAYSMAILLRESGLEKRCQIYCTDINEASLAAAQAGNFKLDSVRVATTNYQLSGGMQSFGEYFRVHLGLAVIDPALRKSMLFANHNVVSDADFGEMDLIFCRNVLIYYGREAKLHSLRVMDSSLRVGGYLVLGSHETLDISPLNTRYEELVTGSRIYLKLRAA
jgi:chemotaxis protein methyltransferase CheR